MVKWWGEENYSTLSEKNIELIKLMSNVQVDQLELSFIPPGIGRDIS